MKNLALFGSITLAVLGLIIAFENILMVCPTVVLFDTINKALFFPLLLMMIIGIGSGILLGFWLTKKNDVFANDTYEIIE